MDGCQSSKSDEYLYGPQLETHRPLMVGASVSLVQNLEAKSPIHASDYPPILGAESPIDNTRQMISQTTRHRSTGLILELVDVRASAPPRSSPLGPAPCPAEADIIAAEVPWKPWKIPSHRSFLAATRYFCPCACPPCIWVVPQSIPKLFWVSLSFLLQISKSRIPIPNLGSCGVRLDIGAVSPTAGVAIPLELHCRIEP
jgi:hypothetical protein